MFCFKHLVLFYGVMPRYIRITLSNKQLQKFCFNCCNYLYSIRCNLLFKILNVTEQFLKKGCWHQDTTRVAQLNPTAVFLSRKTILHQWCILSPGRRCVCWSHSRLWCCMASQPHLQVATWQAHGLHDHGDG